MPYKPHPLFKEPHDKDTSIWRYMSFAKYVSLIQSSALHFASAHALAKEDPFEGQLTFANAKNRQDMIDLIRNSLDGLQGLTNQQMDELVMGTADQIGRVGKAVPKAAFISCWHIAEHESDALWKLYGGRDGGVCVESSFASLVDALSACDLQVFIGLVGYHDYKTHVINEGNLFERLLSKRISFQHESELRAIIVKLKNLSHIVKTGSPPGGDEPGISVNVDLRKLVKRVHVSPLAPGWLLDVVKGVTPKDWEAKVVVSSLAEPPPT